MLVIHCDRSGNLMRDDVGGCGFICIFRAEQMSIVIEIRLICVDGVVIQ